MRYQDISYLLWGGAQTLFRKDSSQVTIATDRNVSELRRLRFKIPRKGNLCIETNSPEPQPLIVAPAFN